MEDNQIIKLFWNRDENAIAKNILQNKEDSDECVNDTYLNAWNTLPPQ